MPIYYVFPVNTESCVMYYKSIVQEIYFRHFSFSSRFKMNIQNNHDRGVVLLFMTECAR